MITWRIVKWCGKTTNGISVEKASGRKGGQRWMEELENYSKVLPNRLRKVHWKNLQAGDVTLRWLLLPSIQVDLMFGPPVKMFAFCNKSTWKSVLGCQKSNGQNSNDWPRLENYLLLYREVVRFGDLFTFKKFRSLTAELLICKQMTKHITIWIILPSSSWMRN